MKIKNAPSKVEIPASVHKRREYCKLDIESPIKLYDDSIFPCEKVFFFSIVLLF